MSLVRKLIKIEGIVQGVGFRPTVFRYALDFKLTGSILNSAQGVFIEIQGTEDQVKLFTTTLLKSPPPMAKIEKVFEENLEVVPSELEFSIKFSESIGAKEVAISPDLKTCDNCLKELFDPKNRRFRYPFINCTDCGPRFTIIRDRPYDRPLTSMASFPFCKECAEEYKNPLDRRFHAQPNACPICGPKLTILGLNTNEEPLQFAVRELKKGSVIGIKGLGGFNLAADPFNEENKGLKHLRSVKNRPTKAFALMARSIDVIRKYAHINPEEELELKSVRAPIVLLRKKENSKLIFDISPDNNYLGIMLPYTPLHHLLMEEFECLIMTSANLIDEPIAINDDEMKKLIDLNIASFAITHNREILHRADDSIVQFIDGKRQTIRYSRGLTPNYFSLEDLNNIKAPLLSFGANMKNTFSLFHQNKITISQHIGELIDIESHDFQKKEIDDLGKLLDFPENHKKITDLHPLYENFGNGEYECQHHYAHLLSVLGEHKKLNYKNKIIGIIADGTGYGLDQTIWGCEFLVPTSDLLSFERVGSLAPFQLTSSEKAIKEIERIKYSLLHEAGRSDLIPLHFQKMLELKLNSPYTSSLGRLFDGVASLLNLAQVAEYEARGAILLQKAAESYFSNNNENYFPVKISEKNQIEFVPMICEVIKQMKDGESQNKLSFLFHKWVVHSFMALLNKVDPQKKALILLSGGVFQNKLLMSLLIEKLKKLNYNFLTNHEVPVNDAGISFGQIIYGILQEGQKG